jgi:Kef-type K+ transport system membrane component KefB
MIEWLQSLTPPTGVAGPTLISYVLLDVFLVVLLARILGGLMAKIRQPRVVGEILAGILLGPTLLGDTLSKVIAPTEARPVLAVFGTLALILFMFVAGIEFDLGKVRGKGTQAGVLAVCAIAIPALLGFPVAKLMHTPLYYGPAGESLLPFALLIGAALSVTAFPVMAHILMERRQLNSPLGSLAVASTLMMSILMFTYIAFAAAVAKGGFSELAMNCLWMVVFGVVSWFVVRPLLSRILLPTFVGGKIVGNGMAIALAGMVLYGLIGHVIGIHAMVGGFVWGLMFPESRPFRDAVALRVRDIAMAFFLPIFFALAGFQTDLKLLTVATIPVVLLVLAGAIGGKFLAAAPARAFGLSWRDVGVLAALFNTRGLLVLVAGLIGLQLDIISKLTFTICVVVALVTNLMTLPLLNWLERPEPTRIGGMAREKA